MDKTIQRSSDLELNGLTRREHEVLVLLRRRSTGREIAERLSISPNTVRCHAKAIYRKLGVHSAAELRAKLGPHSPAAEQATQIGRGSIS